MKLGAIGKGVAVAAVASLTLAACAAEETQIVENTSVSVAWNQPMYTFNPMTTNGYATANNNILYMTQSWFNYYNADQELISNEEFGTIEKLSDEPLTVKYTINEDVDWSDGTDVDEADLLFAWASLSGALNSADYEPEYDEETGQVIEAEGDVVYFDTISQGSGIAAVTTLPEFDENSMTVTYDTPSIDWELNLTGLNVPAHVVAMHALEIEDVEEAKTAVIDAITNNDTAVLAKLANFWNTGFDYTSMPDDASLVVGNGAYTVTDFSDQYVTLEAREGYTAGPAPKVQTITVRFIPDALASIQALQNGEVDMTLPQATTDVLEAAEAIGDSVTITNENESVYEHIDLVFNNGGPFDPATYGGDADKAKLVRQAFLTAIDVNEVLDKLIKPLNPEAEWAASQVFLPGAPGYEDSVANNGSEAYGQGDADAAKALLEEAGVETPIDVNFLYGASNTRRANEYQLFAEQVSKAGFNLIDGGDDNWGSLLGSGTYDASLFAWQSTSTSPLNSQATFITGGGNNFTGYSNETVDSAYKAIETEFDVDAQIALQQEIDKALWGDAYGKTLFQFPGITVYNSDLSNIKSSPLAPQFFWNFWEWEAPAAS